jgi:hypothetical protein
VGAYRILPVQVHSSPQPPQQSFASHPAAGMNAVNSRRSSGHTATLLPNGSVLVVGGAGGSGALNSTELYGPATQTWTLADDLNTARSGHTQILWPPRRGSTQFTVMVAGGRDSHSNSLNSAELFSGPPIIRR